MWMIGAIFGGLTVQVDWLGLVLAPNRRLVCIHQMNRVNYRNGFAMMTAP